MTPKEKWDRLNNPQSADDYGLGMTEAELLTFPEGREAVELMRAIKEIYAPRKDLSKAFRDAGIKLDKAVEAICKIKGAENDA